MNIGLFIGGIGSAGTISEQINSLVAAEEEGFDSFWMAHIMDVDVMSMMCIAAEKTSRIEIATAVTPTYLRHPIAMAQQALTLQTIAKGRFTLGLGVNHKPVVESRFGLKFDKPVRHVREYIEIVKDLFQEGQVNYEGKLFSANTAFTMKERHETQILLAALGPQMLKTAGEMADGSITWMTGPETIKSHTLPQLLDSAKKYGKPKPRLVAAVPVALTSDKGEGFNVASDYFHRYGQLPSYRAMLNREGIESPAEMAIVGNEEEIEKKFREYSEAGTSDLAVQIFPVGPNQKESINQTRQFLRSLIGKI